MSSLWPRLEPLLAKVQKPARYIGGEDGALAPAHDSGKVGWLLVYPDAYEIGLPNQGLQILYEILNERDDAVAERSYAPWLDLEALMRSHRLPLFSVDTHRPASEFDLIAFNLSAELVYTNVLNCIDLAGVPVRAGRPRSGASAHRSGGSLHLQPRAARGLRGLVRDRRRRGGHLRDHRGRARVEGERPHCRVARARAPRAGDDPWRVRAVDVRRRVRRRAPRVGDAALRGRARGRRQAHDRRPRGLAVPAEPARAVDRSRARPTERRGVPRLHPRVPLLPGGDDHAAGARTSRGAGAHDGRRGLASHGLRRGEPHLAVDRGLQRCRARRRGRRERSRQPRPGLGLAPRACGSTRSPSGSRQPSGRRGVPVSRSRPRRARGVCGRSSTSSSPRTTCTAPSSPRTRRAGRG